MKQALRHLLAATLAAACLPALAQEKKWDVANPEGTTYKNVSFTTTEGTWMNLDVSPDGKTIVFDLLGDIYTMPATGGKATVLRSGIPMEVQPRFSPDGKQILFTSDAGGGDNIWVMDRDGRNPRQITKETFRLLNNAAWMPDGKYIVARKHFTSGRSLGAGEIWMYHVSGGGGLQLTTRKNDQQDVNEPTVSPDGRYVYFSEDMYPGGFFQYNKDPNNEIFVIKRLDRETGKIIEVTGGNGGACRPQLSNDGKTLAFIRRVRTKSVLYLRNLQTGEEWPVWDGLSKDQQEAWTIFGSFAGFDFTPDDQHIIIWSNGKINRVDTRKPNTVADIPFTADVNIKIADAVRFQQNINPAQFNAQVIRGARTSPDGKTLVFNAVGYLWKKALPDGKPERITGGTDFEFEPAFSADGKSIVYTTWNDADAGAIYTVGLANGAKPRKLTTAKGIYRQPQLSPDGKLLVFRMEGGSDVLGPAYTSEPGIYTMPLAGGTPQLVTERGDAAVFNKKGDRIYYILGGGMNRTFASAKLDGSDEKIHLKSTYGSQFMVSPDESWVAFIDLHNVYIATFPITGKTVDLGASTADFPVKKVSRDAGINLHWSGDGNRLHYTLGDQYYSIALEDRFSFVAGKPDSAFVVPEKGVAIGLQVSADKPKGITAFTHARIITMSGNEVLEDATLVVEDNTIKAIGKTGAVSIPAGAVVIDATGKTIMPGMIDAHAHGNHFRTGITPQKHWPYYTNLAYGVTTMHDPSANSEMVFAQSELVKAGKMVGPRVFSTGTILYGADGDFKAPINSLEDARSALRRSQSWGAFSVKSYNQPRRDQRQQIIKAARELGMEVVPEGGSFYFHNLSQIMDGHTTIEHNLPIATMYNDVLQLWKAAGTAYTPTLIVGYGAVSGEYYWYQHTNVWENEKLLRFTPRSIIDTRSRHRTMLPEEEYEQGFMQVSRTIKKLNDNGVTVNMGAHGQIQGIGAHWETWMLQQGGMTNLEALKTATINPAKSLGFDKWIGSLEVGKLADLVVMDQNPLENIRNTESIRYTMVNGRLYDAATMNEEGVRKAERPKFYWELGKNAGAFNWHDNVVSEEETQHCGCGRH
ncbi:Imidazolonepropionase [Cnuella takakiae]|uniref:Imidazolonepropionase n=1 Tax=Cnuella takakiae TaxID=1302690 RepID=A0A1M4XC67_9BACT|nr:amidohydrolase family protein [Cnuella takakiae]OLY91469.1 amidohydrolase [Cnuella takakiae]SHE91041.1 Imidazolonepropionase [Cnuella takakiae]